MKPAVAAGALVAAAVIGLAAWQGAAWFGGEKPPAASQSIPDGPTTAPASALETPSDVVTVEGEAAPVDAGATPMKDRVAIVGLLNKRNGLARDLTLKPGHAVRVGDTIVRLRACERTAPWEQEQLTGAFVQLDVQGSDQKWRRAFSGWLYKERPTLNVVQHPVYDVWAKSCTMSFPDKGPATDVIAAPSTARKSAAPSDQAAEEAPSTSESASPSNAT